VTGLGPDEISGYLSALSGISSSCRLYDIHVHPYEILFDKFQYQPDPVAPSLFTIPGKSYIPPSLARLKFPEVADLDDGIRSPRLQGVAALFLAKIYGSVGAQVFVDQMGLSRIDKVLLLPVAAGNGERDFRSRMSWVNELYGNEEKFWVAGSVPPSVTATEIPAYAALLKRHYAVRAMKCHPVVSEIDLETPERKQWLETLLIACSELKLPLIIHGGRNNPYWRGSRGNFGSIDHLQDINFSLSQEPVILAHAGFHNCRSREIEQEGLPILKRMLDRHQNLYVDISGLGLEPLKTVLGSLDSGRILFGSDALYAPQWEAVTMTMHALKELGMRWEERFVEIASINPEQTIFRGKGHD
jgi:predicted TIM-barrel fold metal-dependent hydrolase